MVWDISAAGPRKDVRAKVQQDIDRQVSLGYMRSEHGEAIKACINAASGDRMSIHASGNIDMRGHTGFSVSVSAYFVATPA